MESDDDELVVADRHRLRRGYFNRGRRDHNIRGWWDHDIRRRRDYQRKLRGRLERIAGLHRRQFGQ